MVGEAPDKRPPAWATTPAAPALIVLTTCWALRYATLKELIWLCVNSPTGAIEAEYQASYACCAKLILWDLSLW